MSEGNAGFLVANGARAFCSLNAFDGLNDLNGWNSVRGSNRVKRLEPFERPTFASDRGFGKMDKFVWVGPSVLFDGCQS